MNVPRVLSTIALIMTLALAGLTGGRAAGSPMAEVQRREPANLLVRLHDDVTTDRAAALFSDLGLRLDRRIPRIEVWVIRDKAGDLSLAERLLIDQPEVLWVEPNKWVNAAGIDPDDEYYEAQQYNLRLIGLPEAWVFSVGDSAPIAVLDTGIALEHPDLRDRIWTNGDEVDENGLDDDENGYVDDVAGWDFVEDDVVPQDDHGHGSHVSGIVAAETDNATGIAGTTWTNPIMPLKVLDSDGLGTWGDVAAGIIYAVDNGARVLNLSFGGAESSQTIQDAVTYAQDNDCLIVAAAGNDDDQPAPVDYPAALDGVLAIAATDETDEPTDFSNRGPEIDLAAPGVRIFSTVIPGSYSEFSGTSTATPHVSGVAALVWSLAPALTADQVAAVITGTVQDLYTSGWDDRTGWGRVDAAAAVMAIVQPQVEVVAERDLLLVGVEAVSLTATVTTGQSQPVPDGLSVSFSTTLGAVRPEIALTLGGEATATLTSTEWGVALVTASIGPEYQDTVSLEIIPRLSYLPLVSCKLP